MVGGILGGIAGAAGGAIWSKHMEAQKKELEKATQGTGIIVEKTADNQIKIDIPSDVSFDLNKSNIKPAFQPILDQFAQTLRKSPDTRVSIVGHTDNTGTDAINNPLSLRRAESTRDFLIGQGVDMDRFAAGWVRAIRCTRTTMPLTAPRTDAWIFSFVSPRILSPE